MFVEVLPLLPAAVPGRLLAARPLDQDAADGLGRRREEVAAAVELLVPHQPQVRLMNQGSRVQRLARLLVRELRGGESAQLVVDERQQVRGGLLVANVSSPRSLRINLTSAALLQACRFVGTSARSRAASISP